MQEKGFIKYIVIIVVILVFVFLSQQAFTGDGSKNLVSGATDWTKEYLSKGSEWVRSSVYSKISGEVEKRGDMIKDEIQQEKEKISENILEKTKNYFSGVADSILHPGNPQNCQPDQSPPLPGQ